MPVARPSTGSARLALCQLGWPVASGERLASYSPADKVLDHCFLENDELWTFVEAKQLDVALNGVA